MSTSKDNQNGSRAPLGRFCVVGLLIAGLEEFITQGVLKNTLTGWVLPTLVAFVPFLLLLRAVGTVFDRRLPAPTAVLCYYLAAGTIGLLVEWFLIGLSPWRDTSASILLLLGFQFGMFSFWAGVAMAPRILLDTRPTVLRVRQVTRRWLIFGFAVIYVLTFAVPQHARFGAAILSVLTTFLALNYAYVRYLRALREPARAAPEGDPPLRTGGG
jgi:hypothetical protein